MLEVEGKARKMMKNVKVPGSWNPDVTLLDLETAKVPTDGFVMSNGEPLRNRWSIVMAGVGRAGEIQIISCLSEAANLAALGTALEGSPAVYYAATRQFDEMIAKGRFTNARRAHEPEPFYPGVPGAEELNWVNVLPTARERANASASFRTSERSADVPSKDVPDVLKRGEVERVMIHQLRDVAELILMAEPDWVCSLWCREVLRDYDFAASALRMAEVR
jgi:hypothetical protein